MTTCGSSRLLAALVLGLTLADSQTAVAEEAPTGGQSLEQAASDPTAALLAVQFAGSYEYDFADDYVAPNWICNFTVKLLFPI